MLVKKKFRKKLNLVHNLSQKRTAKKQNNQKTRKKIQRKKMVKNQISLEPKEALAKTKRSQSQRMRNKRMLAFNNKEIKMVTYSLKRSTKFWQLKRDLASGWFRLNLLISDSIESGCKEISYVWWHLNNYSSSTMNVIMLIDEFDLFHLIIYDNAINLSRLKINFMYFVSIDGYFIICMTNEFLTTNCSTIKKILTLKTSNICI